MTRAGVPEAHGVYRTKPNELWVANIPFVPTLAGFLFLAVVMDAWSRRIGLLGRSEDPRRARAARYGARRPQAENIIHHSDQSSQHSSLAFGNRCKDAGVRPSTGSIGDAYDNAICESYFATLAGDRSWRLDPWHAQVAT